MTFQFAWFASPLIDGHYPSVMREAADIRLPRFTLDEQRQLVGSTDFLAVNLCVHVMPYTKTCTSTPCSPNRHVRRYTAFYCSTPHAGWRSRAFAEGKLVEGWSYDMVRTPQTARLRCPFCESARRDNNTRAPGCRM